MSSGSANKLNMSLVEPPTISRPAPPRLRIHHLMACTVVAALLLTLRRNAIPGDAFDQLSAAAKLVSAIGVGFFAIELTFALFSVYWQWKGYAALVQPGQWLLARRLIYLVQMLFGLLVLMHLRVIGPWGKSFAQWSQQDKFFAVVSVLYTILAFINRALPALFYVWCAWRVADTRPWRIFFSLNAIIHLLSVLSMYSMLPMLHAGAILPTVVMLSVLIWIVTTEFRRQQRYWTHWLGVGLCVATAVLGLASGLMSWLGWY